MTSIQSIQDLTIDLSRLGAIELKGDPLSSSPSSLRLSFSESPTCNALELDFTDFLEAQRMYNRLAKKWLDFEKGRSQARLVAEVEKELSL